MEKNFPSYIYDHVFRPVILTVTTPEAEALIKKHDGLTIAKYLNMHSAINERGKFNNNNKFFFNFFTSIFI